MVRGSEFLNGEICPPDQEVWADDGRSSLTGVGLLDFRLHLPSLTLYLFLCVFSLFFRLAFVPPEDDHAVTEAWCKTSAY